MKLAGLTLHLHHSYCYLIAALAAAPILPPPCAHAQSSSPDPAYTVTARAMNSRTWTRTVTTTDPVTGVVSSVTQSYQELENGVCYWGTFPPVRPKLPGSTPRTLSP